MISIFKKKKPVKKEEVTQGWKIHDIDITKKCLHEIWGVTCERHSQIMEGINSIVGELVSKTLKGTIFKYPVSELVRRSLDMGKNENERIYISHLMSKAISKAMEGSFMEKYLKGNHDSKVSDSHDDGMEVTIFPK